MIEQLITVYIGAAIIGITYIAWLLSGAFNVAYSKTREWSWQRFFEDFLKVILRLGFLGAITIAINLIEWYCRRLGADVSKLADIFSVGGVAALTAKASASYASRAYSNFKNFIDTLHTEPVEIEIDPKQIDWQGIRADVEQSFREFADALTPEHLQTDQQTDENATLSDAEVTEVLEAEGRGEDINPLNRILPDGDDDGGKGWQCSKYAGYLATGKRQYSTKNPDYGPVNGRDMVDYLIRTFGWVECKKQNGAIFSYNTGAYGHTGIVKDAKNNIVNDANWQPLKVGTHYLNLDAVGARYVCPKAMMVSTTNSQAKAPQTANTAVSKPVVSTDPSTGKTYVDKPLVYRKGEIVVPLRKVDYDGRKLRQYDDKYYVVQDVPEGCDRVVLGARGQIWAAMNVRDVEKC